MDLRKLLYLIPFWFIATLSASNDGLPVGARRIGMGGAYASLRGDMWSLWANPAGITGIRRFEGGLFTESRYLISEITAASFGGVVPFQQKHFIGVSASTFGFGAYRRNEGGIAYATTLYEVIHLGVKFNLVNLAISNYGSVSAFVANVGVNADVSKKFSVGFWTQNANQARIGTFQEERLSTILNGGVTFRPSDKLILTGDAVKYLDYPLGVRSGFEYYFVKAFCVRAGYSTSPSVLNAGAGFRLDNISIDFANSYHERLGYSPHLSITLRLGKSEPDEEPGMQKPEAKSKPEPAPKTKPETGKKADTPVPATTQPEKKTTSEGGKPEETKPATVSPVAPAAPKPKAVLPVTATPQEIKAAKKAAKESENKPAQPK